MNAEDLIVGSYYKIKLLNGIPHCHYFKLREISGNKIYADKNMGFTIYVNGNDNGIHVCDFKYYEDDTVYDYFNVSKSIYEEVEYSDIIDLLPSDNLYKIIYLRKQRIKILLNK